MIIKLIESLNSILSVLHIMFNSYKLLSNNDLIKNAWSAKLPKTKKSLRLNKKKAMPFHRHSFL